MLQRLAATDGIRLAGVGTQPDRAQGRKRHLAPTPVGAAAAELGLAADKPANVNAPDFLERLRSLVLDLIVVVSFGQLLKPALFTLPRCGCLNAHASLLPRHRGASPIQAAILAGDAETGISFMQIDQGLDTGPVYRQVRLPLRGDETGDSLESTLAELGAAHLPACVRDVCAGGVQPVAQPDADATLVRKIKKEQGLLDWRQDCRQLERQIRAFHPWPGTWFHLPSAKGLRRVAVTAARVRPDLCAAAGEIVQADAHAWVVACGSGALELSRVIPEGRGEMGAAEFLRGCPVATGTRLEHDINLFTDKSNPQHETDLDQRRRPGDPGRRGE